MHPHTNTGTDTPAATATVDPRLLPPQLRALVEAIGPASTVRLLKALGGQRIRIAQDPELCQALRPHLDGEHIAALCRLWGGQRLELPKHDKIVEQLRNARIRADTRTLREIAGDYGLTRRWIIAIRNGAEGPEPDARQPDLFTEARC